MSGINWPSSKSSPRAMARSFWGLRSPPVRSAMRAIPRPFSGSTCWLRCRSSQRHSVVALNASLICRLRRLTGVRDWIYAVDVAEAVALLIEAERPKHQLYNISTGVEWSALQWGQELAALHPGFNCRLAETGETPTVDLHSTADRAPLSVE